MWSAWSSCTAWSCFAALIPAHDNHVGDSLKEKQAVTAASTEALNLLSFRRAHFAADYQRALNGTTGALKADVRRQKATTLKTMTKGKFDLVGKVTHKALEGPAGSGKTKGYVVLVTVNGYQSTAKAQVVQQTLAVTMVQSGTKWLASDVTNIGVS